MRIGVITNPNSRKNRNKVDRAARLQSIIGELGTVHETPAPEAIKPILRDFLRRRAEYWVSDGGDGALHWLLRMGMEVLEEQEFAGKGFSLPLALPTNGGSIDFVAHNVGIKGNAESILHTLRQDLVAGREIQEREVDSMLIEGIEVDEAGVEQPFRTYGFAVAAGGIGQRFFAKLDAEGEHTGRNIVSVIAKTVGSFPMSIAPLRHVPGIPNKFKQYARDMFEPTHARVTLDGRVFPAERFTGINIASMSINLGNVLRYFKHADEPDQLHAMVGAPSPLEIIANIPNMTMGRRLAGKELHDGPCREMTIEALGDEHLAPVVDGEYYKNVRKVSFRSGPRVRIPKVVGRPLPN
ncbi:MAG: hypothetical protein ABI333_10660 [bacterium]